MANPEGCNQYKVCGGGSRGARVAAKAISRWRAGKVPDSGARRVLAHKGPIPTNKAQIRYKSTSRASYATLARRAGIGVREAKRMGFTLADIRGHLQASRGT